MRIAFVGKGGSGKTTISALFTRHIASLGLPVVAIDADINQHMGEALGFTKDEIDRQPAMGLEIDRIKEYVRGTNSRISSNKTMAKTTPPGNGSRLLKIQEENPLWQHFGVMKNGMLLLATGPFSEEDLGIKCYHSKTGAVEIILNHLIDGEKEYVVQDMTAGADSFASGMFTKFDMTFLVAEPTARGVSVYKQYKEYAKDHNVRLRVIGNKVEDEDDQQFLKDHIGDDLVAIFGRSRFVKQMEKGHFQDYNLLEPEHRNNLQTMLSMVDNTQKDWEKFYKQTIEFHIRNAESWANAQVGEDLTKQVDPQFSLASL